MIYDLDKKTIYLRLQFGPEMHGSKLRFGCIGANLTKETAAAVREADKYTVDKREQIKDLMVSLYLKKNSSHNLDAVKTGIRFATSLLESRIEEFFFDNVDSALKKLVEMLPDVVPPGMEPGDFLKTVKAQLEAAITANPEKPTILTITGKPPVDLPFTSESDNDLTGGLDNDKSGPIDLT